MSRLLEKALERIGTLPEDEQDAIAWKARFTEKRDVIRRMAREALEEDAKCETLQLSDLL
jgi:hypothetical protein